jgi:hypothetical protein
MSMLWYMKVEDGETMQEKHGTPSPKALWVLL